MVAVTRAVATQSARRTSEHAGRAIAGARVGARPRILPSLPPVIISAAITSFCTA